MIDHNMTNHCTYTQALALKELGFDMPVRDYYGENSNDLYGGFNRCDYSHYEDITSAPTRCEVLQWARENKGIDGWVRPQFDSRLLE